MYLLGEGIIITIDIINNYCENYIVHKWKNCNRMELVSIK